jgi:ParB-like nuclease domain
MLKARDRVLKSRWVSIDELIVAPYYPDLYPLPRDRSGLRWSFERHGYRPEYPVVVRARGGAQRGFEIVCGVGRHAVARECGMRRVPVVVRRFDDDDGSRAYAIEDNLFNSPAFSRPSLAHMIVLAGALNECGGQCTPRQVWETAGVSPSTYWRADGSLARSLGQILSAHPELQELSFSLQVAEIIRKGLAPQLTRLFAGDVEVNTFHLAQGLSTRLARRVEGKTSKSRKDGECRRAPDTVPAKSNKSDGKAPAAAKTPKRKKPAKNDSNLSLLDLLLS